MADNKTFDSLEQAVADKLTEYGVTLSSAESCTGGLMSKRITDISGASKFYKGGACTYCNEIKVKILGVKQETLDRYTAVSVQTAGEMARGAARVFQTDIGIGITGYAGPDGGTDGVPAGTVHIAMFYHDKTQVCTIYSPRGRDFARRDAVNCAFRMILQAM